MTMEAVIAKKPIRLNCFAVELVVVSVVVSGVLVAMDGSLVLGVNDLKKVRGGREVQSLSQALDWDGAR
jgi:hypothetical protein